METTRRELLTGAGALGLAACLPGVAVAAPGDAATAAMLGEIAEELLVQYPDNACALGIDKGARAALHGRFTDRSATADRARAARAMQRQAQLRAIDRATLSADVALDLDTAQAAYDLAVEGRRTMPVGAVETLDLNQSFRNSPYVVSQLAGAYSDLPDLLENKHDLKTASDADAYLARIESMARAIDGETGRIAADGAQGRSCRASSTISSASRSAASATRRPPRGASSPISRPKARPRTSPRITPPMPRGWCASGSLPRSIARSPPSPRCAPRRATRLASGASPMARIIIAGW